MTHMPPEALLEGRVSKATDVYSFGAPGFMPLLLMVVLMVLVLVMGKGLGGGVWRRA